MDRRNLIKSGLCAAGVAWLSCQRAGAGTETTSKPAPATRGGLQGTGRTFPLKLEALWSASFDTRLYWLRSLLERFGKEAALAVWKKAFRDVKDDLLDTILAGDWQPYEAEEGTTRSAEEILEGRFASPVEGITKAEARRLVHLDPGIVVPPRRFPSLRVQKEVNGYAGNHLRFDGIARVAEVLLDRHGKQGELAAYDFLRAQRWEQSAGQPREAGEVIREWADFPQSKDRNIWTAGINVKLVRRSETDAVVHVTACEWARYFTERHPRVGYLISCSTDDAALLATNDRLRMQRTSTIMEGGKVCDFRVYVV